MKKNKGITLIALVITIIVLLILAGVAIAMLSGENGILKKAAEAKIKTEQGQKEEMGSLLSYEMALKTDSKYKYQYGFITGFEYDKENQRTVESVQDFENSLPKGYKVTSRYRYKANYPGEEIPKEDIEIEENTKSTTYISTGMAITKDGQEVARTVLFGDVNCDGEVNGKDITKLNNYMQFGSNYTEYSESQKIAGNVYNDGELDENDIIKLLEINKGIYDINQKSNIMVSGRNLKRLYTKFNEYIDLLDRNIGYSFEYNNETDTYKLKGVMKGTKVETLIGNLPNSENVNVVAKRVNEAVYDEVAGSSDVISGYYIRLKFIYDESKELVPIFAYIDVEE